jgi:hypothetical protein
MTSADLTKVNEWRVVAHEPWGIQVALVTDPKVRGTIALPYLRDLGPDDRIDGPEDFPPVGETVHATMQVQSAQGTIHLTARETDLARVR